MTLQSGRDKQCKKRAIEVRSLKVWREKKKKKNMGKKTKEPQMFLMSADQYFTKP